MVFVLIYFIYTIYNSKIYLNLCKLFQRNKGSRVHPYSFAVSFLYTQCYILATTLILVENLTLTNAFAFLKLRFASS